MASCALADQQCVPCKGGVPALAGPAVRKLAEQLADGWRVQDDHHIEKAFTFRDFRCALAFTNRVGAIAEDAGHHPEIVLNWGSAVLRIWTQKINGLTESDFILAAKIDQLPADGQVKGA